MAGLAYGVGGQNIRRIGNECEYHPCFVRRILAKLSNAGLVETATGRRELAGLPRPEERFSLLDVTERSMAPKAFSIHGYKRQKELSSKAARSDRT